MAELKTSIRIEAKDDFSAVAKKIGGAGTKLGKQLAEAQGELAEIGVRAKKAEGFRELAGALRKTGVEMARAQERTAQLGRRIAETAKPTKKLRQEFEAARRVSRRLKEQHREQQERLQRLRSELRGAGIDSRKLGEAQRKLAADMERATGRMERMTMSADRIGRARERADRAGRFAVGASLVGGEISRVGASIRGLTTAPLEAAAQVARSRGRLATLSMSEAGIGEVERIGRALSRQYAGVDTAGFVGAAYDVRSAMSDLSEMDVAAVTGIAAELGRAADATTEEMTSAVSGAYGVFKGSLFRDLEDVAFVEKFGAQLSGAVEMFRTTGGRMEQAIKAMGAGLSLSGIKMSEQIAALGKLQLSMDAGEAGTAMRSYRQGAVAAQEAFREAGLDIAVIDEATGKLRPIASVLDDMERVFGEELEDREAAQIKEAFGRDEAVRVIEGLWGSGEELRAAAGELEAATMADVRQRAQARDEHLGGALDRMQQRWTSFTELLGQRLEPTLMRLEPHLDRAIGWLEAAVTHAPGWTTLTMTIVGAVGLIAAPLANLVIAFGALRWALEQIRLRSLQAAGALRGISGGGPAGGPMAAGGKGGKGGRIRGLGGKVATAAKGLSAKVKSAGGAGQIIKGFGGRALGLLKGKAGLLGAGIAALSVGSTLLDDELSGRKKAAQITKDAGAIGGGLAGAGLGAAIGTAVLPGVGTLVGGLIGSFAGGFGGEALGGKIGSLFRNETAKAAPVLTPALAAAGAGAPPMLGGLTTGAGASIDQGVHVGQLTIQQQPGEDAQALADRILREIAYRSRLQARDALHDEL